MKSRKLHKDGEPRGHKDELGAKAQEQSRAQVILKGYNQEGRQGHDKRDGRGRQKVNQNER